MGRTLQKRCPVCGKTFEAKRSDQMYDSPKCRSLASYYRRSTEKNIKGRLLSHAERRDVYTLRKYSAEAADVVDRVAAVCGVQIAQEVLDGYWSILVALGVQL